MQFKNRILVVITLITVVNISSAITSNNKWNLLEGYVQDASEFKEFEIGKKIVYWKQRKIGEAIVEMDQIIFKFDKKDKDLVDVKMNWREDLPPILPNLNVTKEKAESMIEGTVQFSNLYFISPETDIFSPIHPTPKNPCWVVNSIDQTGNVLITVIDAVEVKVLGYGISPPSYTAFSLKGPVQENPCSFDTGWDPYYRNAPSGAKYWFDIMGYATEDVQGPTEDKVKSHIQSDTTAMFYEIAHSRNTHGLLFASGCLDGQSYELTTAEEISGWISGYTKMPFSFLANCFGMCDVNEGTLSYELRMGSERDTTTVGYCCMSCEKCYISCWVYSKLWQKRLFECMNAGYTVKDAFDEANGDYPGCLEKECMRFAGDENFAVVPLVPRVPPFPTVTIIDDVNDDDCVYPWNPINNNYLTYQISYAGDGNEANNVIIVDKLPDVVDYYSSDPCGFYDSNSRTITWNIGHISATGSGSIELVVKVNESARPGSSFRNFCEIGNDQHSSNAVEKTKVCCWGPDIIYVDKDAQGYENGTSWSNAYTELADAMEMVGKCPGSYKAIWVAVGTYEPTNEVDYYSNYMEKSFELVDGIGLFGHFGGTEMSLAQRDFSNDVNETILDGLIGLQSTVNKIIRAERALTTLLWMALQFNQPVKTVSSSMTVMSPL